MLIRGATEGESWVDDVQEGMKNMMSAEAAAAAPKFELSEEAKAATNSAQIRFHEAAANPEMAASSLGGGGGGGDGGFGGPPHSGGGRGSHHHLQQQPPPQQPQQQQAVQQRTVRLAQMQQQRSTPLRQYHNNIKRKLIAFFAHGARGAKVLDLCAGRGGDLHKWADAGVGFLLGLDLSQVQCEEANRRFHQMKSQSRGPGYHMHAQFRQEQCLGKDVRQFFAEVGDPTEQFALVSCMFALHYFFASESILQTFLATVAANLREGGIFLGCLPDGERIERLIEHSGDKSTGIFSNGMLTLHKQWIGEATPFGSYCKFALIDTVTDDVAGDEGSEEPLAKLYPFLEQMARKAGLELISSYSCNSRAQASRELEELLDHGDVQSGAAFKHFSPNFSKSAGVDRELRALEEASKVYATFVFRKISQSGAADLVTGATATKTPPLLPRPTDTAAAVGMAESEQSAPADAQNAVVAAKIIESRAHSATSASLPESLYTEQAPWPRYTAAATNSAAGGATVQGTSSLSRFDRQNIEIEKHYDSARGTIQTKQQPRPAIQTKQKQRLPAVLESYQHTAHFDQRQVERNVNEEDWKLVLRNPDYVVRQQQRDKYVKILDGNRTITLITEGSLHDLYRQKPRQHKLITTYAKDAAQNPVVIVFLSVLDDGRRKLLTTVDYPCKNRWPCLDILGSMAQFKFKGLSKPSDRQSSEMHGSQSDNDEKCLYHAAQLWTLKASSILLDVTLFTDAMSVDECINATADDKKWSQNRHGDKLISLIADVADIDPDLKLVPQPLSPKLVRDYAVHTSTNNGKVWNNMVKKFENSTVWVLDDGDDGDERSLVESIYDYVRAIN
eukprot:COSAG02_NODE_2444_length_8852_cov_3.142008_7_plen_844_part_01